MNNTQHVAYSIQILERYSLAAWLITAHCGAKDCIRDVTSSNFRPEIKYVYK
jgi:hypothetical protein